MQKNASFKIKGMQRDLSVSAFNSEYAYENKNVRIMSTDENTMFSLVNEKGNKSTDIQGLDNGIEGIPIGQAVIGDELVLFTCGETINETSRDVDRIYKLWFNDQDKLEGKLLFNKDLGFNYKYPIETLSFYENSDIKKVYWTDGNNQPRVINIASVNSIIDKWDSNSFDFVRKLRLNESIDIIRSSATNGIFAAGVIQYAFTYFNKYSQESNIFYTSPLYYISYDNRGASPEDKVSCSFNIEIENADPAFDYIRVYSIHRTSINAIPTVKQVVDLSISGNAKITYTDNGTSGNSVDPTELLYVGGEEIIAGTITQKDNTLFLGDIKTSRKSTFSDELRSSFREMSITFSLEEKSITPLEPSGYYSYKSQLKMNSYQFKTFKYLEYYRFGIQAQHYTGRWSEPIFIGDFKNNIHINTVFYNNSDIKLPIAKLTINDNSIFEELHDAGYIRIRPVIVYPSIADREAICQGVLCPTVYNVADRFSNSPFVQSSWFTRPNAPFDIERALGEKRKTFVTKKYNSDKRIANTYSINGYMYRVISCSYTEETITKFKTYYIVAVPDDPNAVLSSENRTLTTTEENKDNLEYVSVSEAAYNADWTPLHSSDLIPSRYSKAGILSNNTTDIPYGDTKIKMDIVNKGSWAEFRHNHPIPSNNQRNAEIQCIWNPPKNPYISPLSINKLNSWVSDNSENFYVDQSILTFHSPDIEFDTDIQNLDSTGLKLRIVGVVPLTAFSSDIDIQTSTPVTNFKGTNDLPTGFYKEFIGVTNDFYNCKFPSYFNDSPFGYRGLISGAFWFDEIVSPNYENNSNKMSTGFVVYPWHRNGSLNNTSYGDANTGYKSAMLDKKRMSNIRYSYKTQYIDVNNIWRAYIDDEEITDVTKKGNYTGISGVSIFNSNEVSLVRIPAPKNSKLQDINYYGNVDKLLTISRVKDKKEGYPIITTGNKNVDGTSSTAHDLFINSYRIVEDTEYTRGFDPVRIKYKSTPHAVLALNYTKDGKQRVLPTIQDSTPPSIPGGYPTYFDINSVELDGNTLFFWDIDNPISGIYQDIIHSGIYGPNDVDNPNHSDQVDTFQHGWLWLGELYNDNVVNRFGGDTPEALTNNIWLPCGDPISIEDNNGNLKSSITVKWIEGDTYYQRYDHIKTYPFTTEDQNQVTDIISFMCETRVNLDGRYDRNRGQTSNLAITPENFNKVNDVYSQQNNFFTYRSTNPNELNPDTFHNIITWTKSKTAGELIDTWTNITLASTLDLDGDKGRVTALRRLNNDIIAFQDKGISQILYNDNMQIASTEGVPIEVANSGKVNGKRYLSDKIGCPNKWSICETPIGIYFIDDITKGIFLFNGQLNNISDKLGFHSWINKVSKGINIWNPIDFNGFVTYHDKVNGDVFFINKNECLGYSEVLGQFTSFYSYENTPYFTNLQDRGIAFNVANNVEKYGTMYRAWVHNEGDYNMFFGEYKPFYTTVIANPDMQFDKIFNNLEFRADSWDKDNNLLNTTFDTLDVWNEYQQGRLDLVNVPDRPSSLKKKFRIWRTNIPRDVSNNRDRMRNPWLYIKLSMNKENIDKTILHDMVVHYFE